MTSVLIIDDHDKVREALEARLEAANIEVVSCTGCWKTGLRASKELEPDVVLLETKRADGEGMKALHRLTERCPCTSIIVLTSYQDDAEKAEALRTGATQYLLKDIDSPQLVHKIKAANRPRAMI